jgi:hypothetical protein
MSKFDVCKDREGKFRGRDDELKQENMWFWLVYFVVLPSQTLIEH